MKEIKNAFYGALMTILFAFLIKHFEFMDIETTKLFILCTILMSLEVD